MPSIQDIMAKKKAFEAELSEFGKAALSEEFKKTFDAHPDLIAIRWRQYTPYFNDGDPCTFRLGDFDMKFPDTPEDGGDCEDGFESTYGERRKSPVAEAVSALGRIDRQVYESVFGDHCTVTATREGFEVEEYEHD